MKTTNIFLKITLVILAVSITGVLISVLSINADKFPVWSGFGSYPNSNSTPQGYYERGKTLWDWLDLLLVPVGLAILAFFLNRFEKQREEDSANETTLQSYLDKMTELLLEKKLLTSKPGDEVRTVARARTLTALRVLDPRRKGVVLQFLAEAQLIQRNEPIVSLIEADLSNADLRSLRLKRVNLSQTTMTNANLSNADIRGTDFTLADLSYAKLNFTFMKYAKCHKTVFYKADLKKVYLRLSDLTGARFEKANLQQAMLHQAIMLRTDVTRARLNKAGFLDVDTSTLVGVTPKQLGKAVGVGKKSLEILNASRLKREDDNDDKMEEIVQEPKTKSTKKSKK